jgi:hypothetical protein
MVSLLPVSLAAQSGDDSFYVRHRQEIRQEIHNDLIRQEQQQRIYLEENRRSAEDQLYRSQRWENQQKIERQQFEKPWQTAPTRLDHRNPAQREKALEKQRKRVEKEARKSE